MHPPEEEKELLNKILVIETSPINPSQMVRKELLWEVFRTRWSKQKFEEMLSSLLRKGDVYVPREGFLKTTSLPSSPTSELQRLIESLKDTTDIEKKWIKQKALKLIAGTSKDPELDRGYIQRFSFITSENTETVDKIMFEINRLSQPAAKLGEPIFSQMQRAIKIEPRRKEYDIWYITPYFLRPINA